MRLLPTILMASLLSTTLADLDDFHECSKDKDCNGIKDPYNQQDAPSCGYYHVEIYQFGMSYDKDGCACVPDQWCKEEVETSDLGYLADGNTI